MIPAGWFFKNISPLRILVLGFILITLTGTVLLMLPEASVNGTSQTFADALFTAVSGVSTTGLIVVDTGSYYTLFGQWVILVLIQIGGLGYMVFIVLVFLSRKKDLSLQGRKILRESLSRPLQIDMNRFTRVVFAFTFIIELCGTAGMYYILVPFFYAWPCALCEFFPFGIRVLHCRVRTFQRQHYKIRTQSLSQHCNRHRLHCRGGGLFCPIRYIQIFFEKKQEGQSCRIITSQQDRFNCNRSAHHRRIHPGVLLRRFKVFSVFWEQNSRCNFPDYFCFNNNRVQYY